MNTIINKLDLNLFSVFEAIYTERNLTKAGQILGITQPAVSNALSRLREMFNDELFTRSPNGMQPTPVAENSIQSVREALHLLRVSVQESHVFNPATASKNFHISCGDIFEAIQIPALLKTFATEAPSIDLTAIPLNRKEMSNQLASGITDVVIDIARPTSDQVYSTPFVKDEYVFVIRESHPLATEENIDTEKLLSFPHIQISSRLEGPGYEDVALAKAGDSRRIGFRTPHIFSACLALQRTDLIALIPKSLSILFKNVGPVKIHELPFEMPALEMRIYWHETMDKDPANIWLREKMLEIRKRWRDVE